MPSGLQIFTRTTLSPSTRSRTSWSNCRCAAGDPANNASVSSGWITVSASTSAIWAASLTASRSASRRAASDPPMVTAASTTRMPATSWTTTRRVLSGGPASVSCCGTADEHPGWGSGLGRDVGGPRRLPAHGGRGASEDLERLGRLRWISRRTRGHPTPHCRRRRDVTAGAAPEPELPEPDPELSSDPESSERPEPPLSARSPPWSSPGSAWCLPRSSPAGSSAPCPP